MPWRIYGNESPPRRQGWGAVRPCERVDVWAYGSDPDACTPTHPYSHTPTPSLPLPSRLLRQLDLLLDFLVLDFLPARNAHVGGDVDPDGVAGHGDLQVGGLQPGVDPQFGEAEDDCGFALVAIDLHPQRQ